MPNGPGITGGTVCGGRLVWPGRTAWPGSAVCPGRTVCGGMMVCAGRTVCGGRMVCAGRMVCGGRAGVGGNGADCAGRAAGDAGLRVCPGLFRTTIRLIIVRDSDVRTFLFFIKLSVLLFAF